MPDYSMGSVKLGKCGFQVASGTVFEPMIKALIAAPSEGDGAVGIIYPPVSLDSILELTHSNAFHTTCLQIKADMTMGLEYEAPKQVENFLETISGNIPFLERIQPVVYDWECLGNGFLEISRSRRGQQIGEIGHVHGHTVYVVQDGNRIKEYRQETHSIGEQVFSAFGEKDGRNELFHFRRYTPLSSFYGLPSWIAALEALRLDQQKKIFYSAFFKNFAVPSLAVVLEGAEFDETTEQTIKNGLTAVKGVENAHRTVLISTPFENSKIRFERLMMDLKDMPFDKLSQATREEILAAHAVPPRLVGIVTAGALGGGGEAEGQMQIFNEITIRPRMAYVERQVRRLLRDSGVPEEFKLKGIIPKLPSVEVKEAGTKLSPESQEVLKSLEREWA